MHLTLLSGVSKCGTSDVSRAAADWNVRSYFVDRTYTLAEDLMCEERKEEIGRAHV